MKKFNNEFKVNAMRLVREVYIITVLFFGGRSVYNWIRPHFFHGKTSAQSIGWIAQEIKFEDFVKLRMV